MANDPTSGYGQQDPTDSASDFNVRNFHIRQVLARVRTIQLVEVLAVTPANDDGQDAPAGSVDVQILVNQMDGIGNTTPHGTTYNLPYLRLQAGGNAIIIDPQVGDIGAAGFCDRDISSVKKNKARANPGSFRRFSPSDGLYFGGFLNGTPNQAVRFSAEGIEIFDKFGNIVNMAAGRIDITTPLAAFNTPLATFNTIVQLGVMTAMEINAIPSPQMGWTAFCKGAASNLFLGSMWPPGPYNVPVFYDGTDWLVG